MGDVMGGPPESPIAGIVVDDGKLADAATSPKRRRGATKRVVTVPISEVEGTRLKGEGAPPADSWAWRKYGQKPIKGSPYPRGYYRCSSSKGCPARKQVERSRADPSMLVVTYASGHNHSSPCTRSSPSSSPAVFAEAPAADNDDERAPEAAAPSGEDDDKFAAGLGDGLLPDDFSWFSAPRANLPLHSPIWEGDGGVVVQMGEEDESLFADLGELPECSVVFRRCEDGRRRGLASASPWCGSTG